MFGVMDGRREIGRVMYVPEHEQWVWALRWSEQRGFVASREAALAALARAWGGALP